MYKIDVLKMKFDEIICKNIKSEKNYAKLFFKKIIMYDGIFILLYLFIFKS